MCGLEWEEGPSWGVKVVVEFTDRQSSATLLSVPGIEEENLLGLDASNHLGESAHNSIHRKIEGMIEKFRKGLVHFHMREVGITEEATINAFCL
jgi:hypothetical protein